MAESVYIKYILINVFYMFLLNTRKTHWCLYFSPEQWNKINTLWGEQRKFIFFRPRVIIVRRICYKQKYNPKKYDGGEVAVIYSIIT